MSNEYARIKKPLQKKHPDTLADFYGLVNLVNSYADRSLENGAQYLSSPA
jgi:hypothetical protein